MEKYIIKHIVLFITLMALIGIVGSLWIFGFNKYTITYSALVFIFYLRSLRKIKNEKK